MKVTKVENPSGGDPITYNPQNMSITNSFNSWHVIPDTYTKVAEYHATVDSSTTDTALGAKVETTYASYIAPTQAADTYTGKSNTPWCIHMIMFLLMVHNHLLRGALLIIAELMT